MYIAFLIGRILLGGYFIMMGLMHFGKKDMMVEYARSRGLAGAGLMTILSGLLMLLAGLGVLLGVYTELSIYGLVLFLVLASFMIHHFWTDQDPKQKMQERMHFMTNLAMAGAILMLLAISTPWMYSLL